MHRTPLLAALAASITAAPLAAAPLDRSRVAASAPWVLHVDVEAGLRSTVGRHVVENRQRMDLGDLDALKAFGIDPFKDIKGVTAFGRGDDGDDEKAVAVIATTPAVEPLVAHLKTEPHAKPMTVSGYDLISWEDHGKRQYGQMRQGRSADERLIYISDDWELVVEALQVADGKSPSQASAAPAGADAAAPPGPGDGSVVYLEARRLPSGLRNSPDPNASAILGGVQAGWVDVGEAAGSVYSKGTLSFAKAETAANVLQIGQGLLALGKLVTQNDPGLSQVRRTLDKVTLTASDRSLTVSATCTPDEVIAALDEGIVRKHAEEAKDAAEKKEPAKKD